MINMTVANNRNVMIVKKKYNQWKFYYILKWMDIYVVLS